MNFDKHGFDETGHHQKRTGRSIQEDVDTDIISLPESQDNIPEGVITHDLQDRAKIVQVTLRLGNADILGWLKRIDKSPKVYWCSRDKQFEIGGVGATLTTTENDPKRIGLRFNEIENILRNHTSDQFLGFIGGCRFDLGVGLNNSWRTFPSFWYVLPEIFVYREGKEFFVSMTSLNHNGIDVEQVRSKMVEKLAGLEISETRAEKIKAARLESRKDYPDNDQWQDNIEVALNEIRNGDIDKVVLARKTDLIFRDPIDWAQNVACLQQQSENSYLYCFQPSAELTFLGASPERLFKIKGRTLISEAVSGTAPRSATLDEDLEYGIRLLHSDKDLREHQFVVDAIKKIKNNLCSEIHTHPMPSLLKLSNVQHLYTRITGALRSGVSLYDLLSTLHPTPAVGGTPRSRALELIDKLEGFDRGWYAGPVGIISTNWTEMVVALRSMLISERKAELFAGAGIVRGSSHEPEWQELESKIAIALETFDGSRIEPS